MKRKLIITSIALACLAVAAIIAIRAYLHSHRLVEKVTAQLEIHYGGFVRLGEVNIGLYSSTIHGVELFEQGSAGTDAPWLKANTVTIDSSLWNLIRGKIQPKRITIQGMEASLRFDRAGELLTRFPTSAAASPGAIPADAFGAMVVEQGEIILRKEGAASLVITRVNAQIDNQKGRLDLSGSSDITDLGKLLLQGSFEESSRLATLHVKSSGKLHVTQALLDRLPLSLGAVQEMMQITSADASADVTARYDLHAKALHYRGALVVEKAKIVMPGFGLAAYDASAEIKIEDDRIRLRDFKGGAFDGSLLADADLDLGTVTKLTITKLAASNLDLNQLPENWDIPITVRKSIAHGRLFGNATLEATIQPALIQPAPVGAGLLAGHKVVVHSRGKGQVRDPAGKQEPIDFDWQIAPRQPIPATPAERTSQASPQFDHWLTALLTSQTTLLLQEPKDKPKAAPNYLDFNFNLKNASLAQVIQNQDVKMPIPVDGKVSFRVTASIPVDEVANIKAYKAKGSAEVTQFAVGGVKVKELKADFHYADGTLYLTSLKSPIAPGDAGKVAGGTMQGAGQIQIAPFGKVQFDLTLDRVTAAALVDLPPDKAEGTFSGNVALRGSLKDLKELQGDATIRGDDLKIYGLDLAQILTSAHLKGGVLKLVQSGGRVESAFIKASAEVHLTGDYSFHAKLDLRDWSLASLEKLAIPDRSGLPALGGTLTTNLVAEGKWSPFEVKGSGSVKTQDLKVAALTTKTIQFRWEADGKKLEVTDMDAQLYDGKLTGTAVIPIDPNAQGKVDLRLQAVNARTLAKDVGFPFAVEGAVDGVLDGTFPPAEPGKPRTAKLHVDVKAPHLRVKNIPSEQIHGTIEYRSGAIDYKLEGKTLGGTFDLDGRIPAVAKLIEPKKEAAKKGRLRIQNVQIAGLLSALNVPSAESINGRLNVDVNYTHEASNWFPEGHGTVRINNLRLSGTRLAENLQGDILLADQQIRVRNLGGEIAQGTLAARLMYNLKQPERSSFALNLDRVESGRLLAPWVGQKIEGPVQVRIRGDLGRTWRGSAELEMARAKISGLEVADLRVPAVWTFAPSQDRGEIQIRETTAQVTRGRAIGKMTLTWEHAVRVEGQLRLERVEFKDLLRQTIGVSDIGSGQTSARFDFSGKNVRSINDIGGDLVASFSQTQALQVPVFSQIAPFLGLSSSTTFQKGDMRARLEGGVLRVHRLALQGTNAQLYVDGTASVDGRLNLAVVAKNGDFGLPAVRLGPIAVQLPIAGPVPLVLLQQATALLANHVAYLQVTGTASSPIIRPQPVPILSAEAVRFFLIRANLPITLDP